MTKQQLPEYSFSYTVESVSHNIAEEPLLTSRTVPLEIFQHSSALQALSRYLVDTAGLSYTDVARLLGRSPKTIWASYRQTDVLTEPGETSLAIPLRIFNEGLAPLEALVCYLRDQGLRNVEIARALARSPKTTHTVWKRAEVKR